MQKAWESSLKNLVSVLETGEDLRFVNRPMLGITLDDFNAEVAEKLGVPVKEGIRIDGVVDGMGAQAAGLQADDVLVGLAGQEVSDWPTLTNALQRLQAGDEIDVTLYRGSEKRTVKMTLSRRPLPEIPETPAALAQVVEKKCERMEATLDDFFAEVSEEQASRKPVQDIWSPKETLAHLIHGERGWHTWMADLVGGFEPSYDDWGGNLQARIDATITAYPTIAELREELRRNCAETVAFLARLPEEFVARKGSYWRLGHNMVEQPYHFNQHLDQMRSAVESALQR
jgi:membrane-associated protease RseP (regulator of RpoE activity)